MVIRYRPVATPICSLPGTSRLPSLGRNDASRSAQIDRDVSETCEKWHRGFIFNQPVILRLVRVLLAQIPSEVWRWSCPDSTFKTPAAVIGWASPDNTPCKSMMRPGRQRIKPSVISNLPYIYTKAGTGPRYLSDPIVGLLCFLGKPSRPVPAMPSVSDGHPSRLADAFIDHADDGGIVESINRRSSWSCGGAGDSNGASALLGLEPTSTANTRHNPAINEGSNRSHPRAPLLGTNISEIAENARKSSPRRSPTRVCYTELLRENVSSSPVSPRKIFINGFRGCYLAFSARWRTSTSSNLSLNIAS